MPRTRRSRCVPAEGAPAAPLALGGQPLAWCWETATYEKASEAEAVGRAAYEARKAAERAVAEKAAWEAKKAAMSKRDRKKAEKKEAEEAEAAALVAAEKEAEAARAAEEAAAAEARRLQDPAVQKELAYQRKLSAVMREAVAGALDAFVETAFALDSEPKLA